MARIVLTFKNDGGHRY